MHITYYIYMGLHSQGRALAALNLLVEKTYYIYMEETRRGARAGVTGSLVYQVRNEKSNGRT
jgi:hypothetical protein